ncbi:VOC family protein [Tautonia plasticadhaerens]|uniref:Glyoxalase-like domain protein n=1 Tax=Tautonia plasticadhaerens TaxID=2527974 RepID=A0A518H881_9BACT|nr:VOC family protein [Tautonia plasticadhaerens]QDV37060.1 Glyoxalase-like domain protein [Tautonia plasticadhaerens]
MNAKVTSVFLYVSDIVRSRDFYHEVVGAGVVQELAEYEGGPIALVVLRFGSFTIMLHPQDAHDEEFRDQRLGLGIHLQIQVEDVDRFYQHCIEQGAIIGVSGEPVDQSWGWREFALRDPDGYVWSVYQDKSDGHWTS